MLRDISRSPLARSYRDKCYVWDQRDRPWCVLPGLVVSMPETSFRTQFQRAWSYFQFDEPYTRLGLTAAPSSRPDLLVSFIGTRTHRCRDPLFLLNHDRAVIEEVSGFLFHDPSSPDFAAHRSRFVEILYRSKFVLCPRGHGTSSFRLFEAMASGRVPVIISDDWVAPVGPDWASFSVRWPESGYAELLPHLEQIEPEAEPMGRRARAAFLEFFADDVAFHSAAQTLSELHLARNGRRFPAHGLRGRRFWTLKLAKREGPGSHAAPGCAATNDGMTYE